MAIEIERKFLVNNLDFKSEAFKKTHIKQGFLSSHKKRVVRVRITDENAYLTIKGKSSPDGLQRFEWEKPISMSDAVTLLELCEKTPIEKIRYFVKNDKHIIEVDEFLAENRGLIIAEIELNNIDQSYIKPNWIGKEVTGHERYYNACLSKNPYNKWKKETLK